MNIFILDSDPRAVLLFQAALHTDVVAGIDCKTSRMKYALETRAKNQLALEFEFIRQIQASGAAVLLLEEDVLPKGSDQFRNVTFRMKYFLNKLRKVMPSIAIVGISHKKQPHIRNCWGDRNRLYSFVNGEVDHETATAERELAKLEQIAQGLRTVIHSALSGEQIFLRRNVVGTNRADFNRKRAEQKMQGVCADAQPQKTAVHIPTAAPSSFTPVAGFHRHRRYPQIPR